MILKVQTFARNLFEFIKGCLIDDGSCDPDEILDDDEDDSGVVID